MQDIKAREAFIYARRSLKDTLEKKELQQEPHIYVIGAIYILHIYMPKLSSQSYRSKLSEQNKAYIWHIYAKEEQSHGRQHTELSGLQRSHIYTIHICQSTGENRAKRGRRQPSQQRRNKQSYKEVERAIKGATGAFILSGAIKPQKNYMHEDISRRLGSRENTLSEAD